MGSAVEVGKNAIIMVLTPHKKGYKPYIYNYSHLQSIYIIYMHQWILFLVMFKPPEYP